MLPLLDRIDILHFGAGSGVRIVFHESGGIIADMGSGVVFRGRSSSAPWFSWCIRCSMLERAHETAMCFKHVAEILDGKEKPYPQGAHGREKYTLKDEGGGMRLLVDLDAPDEYQTMFDNMFPKALRRVRELAEG